MVALGCGSSQALLDGAGLQVQLEVEPTGFGPTVVIDLINQGDRPLGVSPTFVFENDYVHLVIEGPDGRVRYPLTSQFEAFAAPPYRCLRPRSRTRLRIDLGSWYPVMGGKTGADFDLPQSGPHTFSFKPGSYRFKAVYESYDEEVRLACRPFLGRSESDWQTVHIGG